MKTVYILSYSQLVQSNMPASIEAFHKNTNLDKSILQKVCYEQGGLPLSKYKPEEINKISNGAIYLFKTGKINEEEFVNRMNKAIGVNLEMKLFQECWNAMCNMNEKTLEFLHELKDLQEKQDFGIHIIGNTNIMHVNFINAQLKAANINLDMSKDFSFELGVFILEDAKVTDPRWNGYKLVDLRNTSDILEKIKLNENNQKKLKISPRV